MHKTSVLIKWFPVAVNDTSAIFFWRLISLMTASNGLSSSVQAVNPGGNRLGKAAKKSFDIKKQSSVTNYVKSQVFNFK